MKGRQCLAICLANFLFISVPAFAVTTTQTTFPVTATVQATCLVSASTLAFGNYTSVLINQTSSITTTCSNGSAYTLSLNAGQSNSATTSTRMMNNGGTGAGSTLNYTLYRDAARTQNWGNVIGTDTVASTGTGGVQTFTVYGTVPGGQAPSASPSFFADSIQVTATF